MSCGGQPVALQRSREASTNEDGYFKIMSRAQAFAGSKIRHLGKRQEFYPNRSLRGSDSIFDPVPCLLQPIFMRRSIDIAFVLKDPGLSGQPHKLDCRDGVFQDDAGAFHATTVIHRLAPDHHFLGLGWKGSQCPHIDDYAE